MDPTKQELRAHYKHMRDSMPLIQRTEKSGHIVEKLLSWHIFARAQAVMCYSAFGSEADLSEVINHIVRHGKTLLLPVTLSRDGVMAAVEVKDMHALKKGHFDIMEPSAEGGAFDPQKIDLILVPGLAFNRDGYRIGYGKGYYDRFLPMCGRAVTAAVGYDEQLCGYGFQAENDVPVQYIVTDREIIKCG